MGANNDLGDAMNGDDSSWATYKQEKAITFVKHGYSVTWYPDEDNWMDIYTPERTPLHRPEIRASVKFFPEPSKYGINEGRISKLAIQIRQVDLMAQVAGRPYEAVDTVFNFDRGADVDRLDEDPNAKRLYDLVLRELG